MPEPFIWMFKVKDFRKHFIFVSLFCTFLLLAAMVLFFSDKILQISKYSYALKIVSYFVFAIPVLFYLGYFWNITDEIINRDWDVKSASIYNGRTTVINKITLPEINIFKYIWRGFASIVASIFLLIPIILLVGYNLKNTQLTLEYFNLNSSNAKIFYSAIYIFICSFIPALAWNYARRDSVIAVWNFPKAVFIMGNYPIRYWLKMIGFVTVNILNGIFIAKLLNLSFDIFSGPINTISLHNINYQPLIAYSVLLIILNTYILFVNAYFIGTLTPPNENY